MKVSAAFIRRGPDGGAVRAIPATAVPLLLAGIGVLAVAASRGEASAGVVVVFPFVVATGPLGFLGALLLMAAMVAGVLAFAPRARPLEPAPNVPDVPSPAKERNVAGFVLLGPIPIAFGTTRGLAVAMVLVGLAALALLLLLPRLVGGP
jgi:uncharacterized protein (TIGR00304 family)